MRCVRSTVSHNSTHRHETSRPVDPQHWDYLHPDNSAKTPPRVHQIPPDDIAQTLLFLASTHTQMVCGASPWATAEDRAITKTASL